MGGATGKLVSWGSAPRCGFHRVVVTVTAGRALKVTAGRALKVPAGRALKVTAGRAGRALTAEVLSGTTEAGAQTGPLL